MIELDAEVVGGLAGDGGAGERSRGAEVPAAVLPAAAAVAEEEGGYMVSLRAEVPESLLKAMAAFIERHPNWDQYRLFQAALAGFLVQNGVQDRGVTRCYLANLFPAQRRFASPPHRPGSRGAGAAPCRGNRSEV
jgi:hypothetical protein